jgi:amino acid adenylation domain-containing protein
VRTTDEARADRSARWDDIPERQKTDGQGLAPRNDARTTSSAERADQLSEFWAKSDGSAGRRGAASGRSATAQVQLELPWDRPRHQRPGSRTASHPFSLGNELTGRLVELATQEHVMLATTLVASVAALLHRYTGDEQFRIGSTGATYPRDQLAPTMEPFGPDVVLQADLAGQPNVGELLKRMQASLEAECERERVDLDAVADGPPGRPESDRDDPPQVLIRFSPRAPVPQPKRTQGTTRGDGRPTGVDLCLEVEEPPLRREADIGPAGVAGRVLYDSELFEPRTIGRLTEHWKVLLEGMVSEPWCPVGELRLFTTRQRQQLLAEWGVGPEPPPGPDIVDLITERAVDHPYAVAVQCKADQLTYGQLDARANQLARLLRDRGVGPDVIVGLCLERSTEHVVGLLAVLKAGGAFVALDPEAPRERTRYVLGDSRSPLVLTSESLQSRIAGSETTALCLDHAGEEIRRRCADPLEDTPRPDQPAYVSYTSGSTGKPKGVLVERGPLSAHCRAMAATYGLERKDRVLQFSQFSADASLEQILPTLASGARLVMRGGEIWTPEELREELVLRRVTVVNLWPTYWQQAVRVWSKTPAALTGLRVRLVILGGERLGAHLLAQWHELGVQTRLLNAYGPTEGIITATLSEAAEERDLVTIGRPLPGRRVYVLDLAGQLAPIGAVGELYVGGDLLARGYLNRPDLTDERFVADPFDPEGRGRLYRTGDRARYLDDGRIVYLGRVDDQVKMRGYRIELGEVEVALAQHPSVEEAVVVARGDGEDQELVAYVVASATEPIVEEELRQHLEATLPRYMQPAIIAQLAKMPRLATGKPDRRGLPEVERTRRRDPSGYVPPRLLVHEQLIRIWEELVDARPIGIRDNFFHLGGHSLLAAQLVRRVEQTLGKRPALSTLFANPTVEQLAHSLEADAVPGAKTRALPIQTHGDRTPLFFLHGDWTGGGLYCLDLARACGDDQPFFVLEPYRFDGEDRVPRVEAIAKAHIKAMRQVRGRGPYRLGGFCNGGLLAYEMARQLEQDGEQVEFLGLVNPSAPAQRSLLRMACDTMPARDRDGEGARLDPYLRTRHGLRHLYRRARPNAQRVADFGALLSIEPRLAGMFPPRETLLKDYVGVFSWAMAAYRPGPYGGKITFFWAAEEPEIADTWRPVLGQKPPATIEQHTVPGDHLTSVTVGIAELAKAFADSVDRLTSGGVEPSVGQRPRRGGASARNTFRLCDLRGGDVTAVIGIERRSFPKDRWTSATAKGRLARSVVGRRPHLACGLERLLRFARVTEALSGIRLARLVIAGRPSGLSYVVAKSGPKIVGVACLNATMDPGAIRGARAEVETLAVEPDRRGQGIGSALLARLIIVARTAGYSELTLHVRRDNAGARQLYERTGFEEARVISRYYQPSGTDAIVMKLDVQGGPTPPQCANRS